ncbi:MAG: hypothetical protein AB1585_12410 [Thermodesulfobacteriota bacterium]
MSTVQLDLPFAQIKKALRQLPSQEKMELWRLLDVDLDRSAIALRFTSAVNTLRKAYAHISEEEVMKEAIKATRQVRRARHAKSRS